MVIVPLVAGMPEKPQPTSPSVTEIVPLTVIGALLPTTIGCVRVVQALPAQARISA